jgi:hypothetical protein
LETWIRFQDCGSTPSPDGWEEMYVIHVFFNIGGTKILKRTEKKNQIQNSATNLKRTARN